MKYIECKCCSLLAEIPEKDAPEELQCPLCLVAECDAGKFVEVPKETFMRAIEEKSAGSRHGTEEKSA